MASTPQVRQAAVRSLWKPELIETIPFKPGVELSLGANSGQLPRDRYMAGLLIHFAGRITNAGSGNPSGQMAGGVFNLFNKIRVYGKHRLRRNDDNIFNISGVNVAQLEKVYTRLAPTTVGSLANGASATQDLRFTLFIPFVPMQVHPAEQKNHLLDAPNYETLYLKIDSGVYSSVFTGHSSDGTFSAFGSASGDPSITVTGLFATEPSTKFRGFVPGFLSRYTVDCISGSAVTSNSAVRLFNLPKGAKLRGAMLKAGILQTGLPGGLRAFASLTDTALTNNIVNRGTNRRVWDIPNFSMARSLYKLNKGVEPDSGYALIDWVNSGGFNELFDTTNLVAGQTGEIDFYLQSDVAGNANQFAELVVEEQVVPYSLIG